MTAAEGAEQEAGDREDQAEGEAAEKHGGHDLSRGRIGEAKLRAAAAAANVHPLKPC